MIGIDKPSDFKIGCIYDVVASSPEADGIYFDADLLVRSFEYEFPGSDRISKVYFTILGRRVCTIEGITATMDFYEDEFDSDFCKIEYIGTKEENPELLL